jgi:hypothetical protein
VSDPFANIVDEQPMTPADARANLLGKALRGYLPLRKEFVQRPNTEASRPSLLGEMVKCRQETALRLLLLVLALEPADSLRMSTKRWAQMVSSNGRACTTNMLSAAVKVLTDRGLVERVGTGRIFGLKPLREDGSGATYLRPGSDGDTGKGYFVVPHELWTTGLVDDLKLAGLAVFLISLHDTHQKSSFQVAYQQFPDWYGISERTAERGFKELSDQGILLKQDQFVGDPFSLLGLRRVTWRALADPYSTSSRKALQKAARARVSGGNP